MRRKRVQYLKDRIRDKGEARTKNMSVQKMGFLPKAKPMEVQSNPERRVFQVIYNFAVREEGIQHKQRQHHTK